MGARKVWQGLSNARRKAAGLYQAQRSGQHHTLLIARLISVPPTICGFALQRVNLS